MTLFSEKGETYLIGLISIFAYLSWIGLFTATMSSMISAFNELLNYTTTIELIEHLVVIGILLFILMTLFYVLLELWKFFKHFRDIVQMERDIELKSYSD